MGARLVVVLLAAATVVANAVIGWSWPVAIATGVAVAGAGEAARLVADRVAPADVAQPGLAGGRGHPLTPKELEVAVLVARGLRNKEIGTRLHIRPRTVDNHVQHIYNKLEISSRAELALWVRDRGLLEPEPEDAAALARLPERNGLSDVREESRG